MQVQPVVFLYEQVVGQGKTDYTSALHKFY